MHIALLWRSRSFKNRRVGVGSFKNRGVEVGIGVGSFVYRLHSPGYGNRYSVARVATRLRAGRSGFRLRAGETNSSLLRNVWSGSVARSTGTAGSFPRGLRREVDHSPSSRAEVKNRWSYTSAPSVCLYCLNRDNFCVLLFAVVVNNLSVSILRTLKTETYETVILPVVMCEEVLTRSKCGERDIDVKV
jgi:hypothetical protein